MADLPPIPPARTLDGWRDFALEQLIRVHTQCACAINFADIQDDTGMVYSVNAMKAHFRAAYDAVDCLQNEKARHAQNDGIAQRRVPSAKRAPDV